MNIITEHIVFDGKTYQCRWPAVLNAAPIRQVSAFIFDANGRLLLVKNQHGYGLAGGKPEAGETPEQTLQREVHEEACLTYQTPHFLGAVEIFDFVENCLYHQLRYAALLDRLLPFKPSAEIVERVFVTEVDIFSHISWPQRRIFMASLQAAKHALSL